MKMLEHRDFLLSLVNALLDRGSNSSLKRRGRGSSSSELSVGSRRRIAMTNAASSLVDSRSCPCLSHHPLVRVTSIPKVMRRSDCVFVASQRGRLTMFVRVVMLVYIPNLSQGIIVCVQNKVVVECQVKPWRSSTD